MFQWKEDLITAKLLTLQETTDQIHFLFFLGFSDGQFIKFQICLLLKKIKDHIKNKHLFKEKDIPIDFLTINVKHYKIIH